MSATEGERPPRPPRSRLAKLGFLLIGLAVAAYLGMRGPHEQHLRLVLGDAAPEVTGLEIQYVDQDGEVAREARLSYPAGGAPRVVSHEPELPDGTYALRVNVATRERRVPVERSVTLGGGSTQVDLSQALKAP